MPKKQNNDIKKLMAVKYKKARVALKKRFKWSSLKAVEVLAATLGVGVKTILAAGKAQIKELKKFCDEAEGMAANHPLLKMQPPLPELTTALREKLQMGKTELKERISTRLREQGVWNGQTKEANEI